MSAPAQTRIPEGAKSQQVYLFLRDEISSGSIKEGDRLPSEQQLAKLMSVSRATIRRALEALSSEGLVETRVGAGSVVRQSQANGPKLSASLTNLLPQIVQMDRSTKARLLSFAYGEAPAYVAQSLGLAPKAEVQVAVRVRSTNGQPFSYLTTYVPREIATSYDEHDLASQPLFRLLERIGVSVDSAHQTVTAALATPEVADALGVLVGSPLLYVQRVIKDLQGHGVEYLSALYRPDLFRLEMDLTRVGAGDARHWEPVIGENP